jgi:Mg2+ and Co2+ transporter CorA
MLKSESEEVRNQVAVNQRTAEEKRAANTPVWTDEENCSKEELERRKKAFKRHQ